MPIAVLKPSLFKFGKKANTASNFQSERFSMQATKTKTVHLENQNIWKNQSTETSMEETQDFVLKQNELEHQIYVKSHPFTDLLNSCNDAKSYNRRCKDEITFVVYQSVDLHF